MFIRKQRFKILIMTCLWLISLAFVQSCIVHFKYEMTKVYFEKQVIEKSLRDIIENLEEAIITKTKNGIDFCNNRGYQILVDIYNFESKDDSKYQNWKDPKFMPSLSKPN